MLSDIYQKRACVFYFFAFCRSEKASEYSVKRSGTEAVHTLEFHSVCTLLVQLYASKSFITLGTSAPSTVFTGTKKSIKYSYHIPFQTTYTWNVSLGYLKLQPFLIFVENFLSSKIKLDSLINVIDVYMLCTSVCMLLHYIHSPACCSRCKSFDLTFLLSLFYASTFICFQFGPKFLCS